ncbi:DEAD/DEAH box helicase [Jannaschia sp. LMIT008]|uniref:DEAD/DEAH box helicase n=1 Tax=Jannaschia maritima TaxID=3032585 RepID=UPI0028122BE7|nr:DEAD/DEAH box helicase [Jannaschia sp. LMIT008]
MQTPFDAALARKGYDTPMPVQAAVADPALAGADLLVSAQTGSGKTVAFGLAIGRTILHGSDVLPRAGAPLALVIAPTRELALQVRRELAWLYADAGAVLASTVGGMDMRDERRALARGAHVVVATPGRLRDHIARGGIDLSALRAVVLDEADEMLDLGFREDLEFILGAAPADRQTLLFSATVPDAIERLADRYQRDARRIATAAGASQHADIAYQALSVAPRDGENAIVNVLRFHDAPGAIVFANTRAAVGRIATRLGNRGFAVVVLSGELNQEARSHALQSMRDGRARICVATDVAARGIDLPNLDLVIHAELPSSADTLLHRSGRTGRAGRKGVSALIVPPGAKGKATRLLRDAGLAAEWTLPPSADAVRARDMARLLEDPAWTEGPAPGDAEAVAALAERFDAPQLAAALLRLRADRLTAPEELAPVAADRPERRAPFGPSVWFAVAGGRQAGHEPRRLLPMLSQAGGLDRGDVGAIRIKPRETFVEVAAGKADAFERGLDAADLSVRRAAAPTDARKGPRPPQGKPSSKKNRARANAKRAG